MNAIFVHRSRGTDHLVPGLWRFWCAFCDAPTEVAFRTAATAGDVARHHLTHFHRINLRTIDPAHAAANGES